MSLDLEGALTLAVGAFNPHIITPEWLVKNGVCEDAEVEIRISQFSQGLAFSLKDVQWQIDFGHLMVASRTEDCGKLVARVIDLLPHTPVRAVGNNFHYACTKGDWGSRPLPTLGGIESTQLKAFGELEQTCWSSVIRHEDVRIEITVAADTPGMAVLFNFHRKSKEASEARAAAEQFKADQSQSQEIINRVFLQGR